VYLQDAKVGDYFQIDNEFVVLLAKTGNQWTLQRGAGQTSVASHTSTALFAYCQSREFTHPTSNWSYTWDAAADPHGQNADGTTVRLRSTTITRFRVRIRPSAATLTTIPHALRAPARAMRYEMAWERSAIRPTGW
jgi:hypothetical protein